MTTLFDKVYGIEAAVTIANSMGDVTEGYRWDDIEEHFGGLVTELLPQAGKWSPDNYLGDLNKQETWGHDFIYHPHDRVPGQGEDGLERYRLAVTAIIEKGGRINIEDLARVWMRDVTPDKFGYLMGPQDQVIYYSLLAGVWPWEVGRYATFPGMIGTSKMMIAIGSVNACNPDQAAQDALEIGRIKDIRGPRDNYALEVAAGIAAGTAEAMKPSSDVDRVIATVLAQLTDVPRAEVEVGLEWAAQAKDWKDLRPLYQAKYEGKWISNAVEILSSGLANFYMSGGHVEEAIIQAVNMGRDCDCRAYIAGGFSAALRGIDEVPKRWLEVVTEQVKDDPYTVSRRTPLESAEGMYRALTNNVAQLKDVVSMVESQTAVKETKPSMA